MIYVSIVIHRNSRKAFVVKASFQKYAEDFDKIRVHNPHHEACEHSVRLLHTRRWGGGGTLNATSHTTEL